MSNVFKYWPYVAVVGFSVILIVWLVQSIRLLISNKKDASLKNASSSVKFRYRLVVGVTFFAITFGFVYVLFLGLSIVTPFSKANYHLYHTYDNCVEGDYDNLKSFLNDKYGKIFKFSRGVDKYIYNGELLENRAYFMDDAGIEFEVKYDLSDENNYTDGYADSVNIFNMSNDIVKNNSKVKGCHIYGSRALRTDKSVPFERT